MRNQSSMMNEVVNKTATYWSLILKSLNFPTKRKENETVMFPLYIVGWVLQHFWTLPIEEIIQEFKQRFYSPSQRIQAKNLIGERSQEPNDLWLSIMKLFECWFNEPGDKIHWIPKGKVPHAFKKIFWGGAR